MTETKRMTSISRRINTAFVWRMLWAMVWIDIIVILLAITGWCYSTEKSALGSNWEPIIHRSVEWNDAGSFNQSLGTVVYLFDDTLGGSVQAEAGVYLQSLYRLMQALGAVEVLMLLGQFFGGKRQTRRLLNPLQKMADTAEELSHVQFDEQKYHDLEDAIAKISPTTPEAKLQTGDRELQGLETAVNNLMGRMHEGYRQQIRFVSDASHELRTPISVIQGYADMLARWGSKDEKVLSESISAIRTESQHMQKLVEQLLFLARGEAGRMQMTAVPLDLAEMMREVHEEYEMINAGHEWRVLADTPVPAFGDAGMLKQTVRILADNAAKFSKEGDPITLRAFIDEEGVPCFSVQDNGSGISTKDMPHIFERFYRADPARTRQSGGTGLGLSIAKWIVDKHEGYFRVLSHEGLGTRIEVALPKGRPLAQAAPQSNADAQDNAKKSQKVATGR